ncbi:MAG: preprotein translocase subunit Sec61beta [Nanoarchaeota archaeon]
MADNKIQMPQSGGGIIRYDEGTGSKFTISPTTVIVMIGIVIILAIALHAKGFGLF